MIASLMFIDVHLGPTAPYNLQARQLSDATASLEWLPGDNNVVDRYYIRWSNVADSTDSGEGVSLVTSYDVTGLTAGATYTFNVAAVNRGGTSPFSKTASLTMEEPQPGNLHLNCTKY